MKVKDVTGALEVIAPPHLAADWDNVGLLVGDTSANVGKVMLCIDLTVSVLDEAVAGRAQMVMAYHPVIFQPVNRITADNTPVVYSAARGGISIYCMHTALDAANGGTNDVLADVLGLEHARPIEPISGNRQCKIVVFVSPEDLHRVAEAAFNAGAGRIGNYSDCSFFSHGIGTFCGGEGSRPIIGTAGHHEAAEEIRLEVIAPKVKAAEVREAIRSAHGYETPAIDVYPLEDVCDACGLGRVGRLSRPVQAGSLIARIKKALGVRKVLLAEAQQSGRGGKVTIAACCAGSCGGLHKAAVAAGATFYLTGEMRHHDVLAANAEGMTVCCVGHSNSERLTLRRLAERLTEALPKLKVVISKRDRDPFEIV